MYIDTRCPIRAEMSGKVSQKCAWHSGRTLRSNLLIYLTSGELTLLIGENEYCGKVGDAFLVPAGVKYAPIKASELEYLFFHFSAPNAEGVSPQKMKMAANHSLPQGEYAYTYSLETPPIILVPEHTETAGDQRIKELTDRIAVLDVWESSSEKLLLDCYLRELLVLLSMESRHLISRNLGRIIQYIEKNYREELSLSSLSRAFGLSESYIARLFRNELKMRSSDYINKVRVGAACTLLQSTGMRLNEVSEKTGFSDQYYFSRVFRKLCGVTPTEFRNKSSNIPL